GTGALQLELGERALVEQRHRFARRLGLLRRMRPPGLRAPAVALVGLGAEPERPLPAGADAEAGAGRRQAVVQGGAAHAARRRVLTVGPVHGVVQAQRLHGAVAQEARIGLEGLRAANVDVVEVERRFAFRDPLRHYLADARRRRDADGVEAGGDV